MVVSVLTSGLEVVETSTSFHRPILVSGYRDQRPRRTRSSNRGHGKLTSDIHGSVASASVGGLIAIDPSSGQELWRRPFASRFALLQTY